MTTYNVAIYKDKQIKLKNDILIIGDITCVDIREILAVDTALISKNFDYTRYRNECYFNIVFKNGKTFKFLDYYDRGKEYYPNTNDLTREEREIEFSRINKLYDKAALDYFNDSVISMSRNIKEIWMNHGKSYMKTNGL